MSTIASKNLYDLLGNDPDQDPDRAPDPPVKVIDKPVARTGKRNAGPEAPAKDGLRGPAPAAPAGGRGGRSEGAGRGDQANGRPERRDDGRERRPRGDGQFRGEGRGRGRGGRGRGDRPPRDDRHSHTGIGEQQKQAAQGWGGESGNAEWADEKAGDAIANAEAKNDPNAAADTDARDPAFTTGPDGEVGADAAEEEDKTKSYDQYLAEQKEKRAALGAGIEIRKPNEGSKQKFPEGKAFSRNPEEEEFMSGAGGKTRKAKDAGPKKEQIVVDGQYYAAADSGDRGGRGGRGGARGGSRGGRGEFRGERGGRGRGRGGDFRGGARGGADRGPAAPRGGFNATDESAFPALGGN